jgi:hypothetical protein
MSHRTIAYIAAAAAVGFVVRHLLAHGFRAVGL